MKKAAILIVTFLTVIVHCALAQVPMITLGSIPANTVYDGKMVVVKTTRADIDKNTKLTGNDEHCKITGYTFSVIARRTHWSVVVSGDELTPQILKKLKKLNGPDVKLYFDNIHNLYDGNEASCNAVLLSYDQ